MKHHPEQAEDEIYMGNATFDDAVKSSWRTGRLGQVALDINGNKFNPSNLRPWFINVSEVQQAIETERLSNKPWSAERIRAFQPMVEKRTVF